MPDQYPKLSRQKDDEHDGGELVHVMGDLHRGGGPEHQPALDGDEGERAQGVDSDEQLVDQSPTSR